MKTKIIGLTGGIGSGKTTIAKYFQSLGVPVYIADEEAKKIMYLPEVVAEVKEAFGEGVMQDGLPDRKKLAAEVFANPASLTNLNAIIHPKVDAHFKQWVKDNGIHDVVIKEAAILFESGSYKNCDKVILVTAPLEVRLQRVMQRDRASAAAVKERMANQWDDEKKRVLSDYIIENTNLEAAKHQADNILKELNFHKK